MTNDIRRVAVLGAGTMGAAIAAHAANAGLAVDLLDLDRDAVQGGFERMLAARPAALASPRLADRIRLGTFEEDFDRLADADWVVEAVVERLEPKQELLARVEKTVGPEAVVSSNTSGLPLHSVAEGRSDDFRRRFLGTHFFNPPRYLKLVELIATADTDPEVLEGMRAFVERVLGKGAVVAKDTPNFIANRLGSFAGMHDVRYALEHGYSIEEVDALTGPLVGRPKTATFRLFDQVGLDVMVGVAGNLYELAPDDEQRDVLPAPEPLKRMLEARRLGNKTGGGFYRRGRRDGQTVFDVLDLDTLEYRPAARPDLPIVAAARDHDDLGARLRFLLDKADEDRGARYLRDTLLPSLAYAARRVPEIADSLVEVDHAVEWGFGYELGPFRAWDAIGVADGVARMEALGIEVPAWVTEMLAAGHQGFYRDGQVYSPLTRDYVPVPADPEVIDLDRLKEGGAEVAGNGSASLVDLGDGVLCFELHAPASAHRRRRGRARGPGARGAGERPLGRAGDRQPGPQLLRRGQPGRGRHGRLPGAARPGGRGRAGPPGRAHGLPLRAPAGGRGPPRPDPGRRGRDRAPRRPGGGRPRDLHRAGRGRRRASSRPAAAARSCCAGSWPRPCGPPPTPRRCRSCSGCSRPSAWPRWPPRRSRPRSWGSLRSTT